jgi:hypothetical protein
MTYQATGAILFADEDTCRAQMEAATKTFDAKTLDLAANWRPTGFYRVPDMEKLVTEQLALMSKATAAVDQAIAAGAPASIRTQLRDAQNRVRDVMSDSLSFSRAIAAARQKGVTVIDAPSFKRWVINGLNKVSGAYAAIAYTACLKPGLVSALQALARAGDLVVAIGKAMVRAALVVGEQILTVPDRLADLWTYAKWGSLAVMAFYVLKPKRQNPCRSRRSRC